MNVTLEKHNENLVQVAGLLTEEKQCAVTIAPEHTEIQLILEEQKKKTAEAFKVLIVGDFNAGKSSMINALAGRKLLPTGSLPETGVITELVYGEQYRITLYPKEGSGITEPIVLVNPAEDAQAPQQLECIRAKPESDASARPSRRQTRIEFDAGTSVRADRGLHRSDSSDAAQCRCIGTAEAYQNAQGMGITAR